MNEDDYFDDDVCYYTDNDRLFEDQSTSSSGTRNSSKDVSQNTSQKSVSINQIIESV